MQATNITTYTDDASQIDAIKAFMKALKIKFEMEPKSTYNKKFVTKIVQGDDEFKKGKSKSIKTEDLWK
jgi:uncharacterized protein with ATP-grasp and redox domains